MSRLRTVVAMFLMAVAATASGYSFQGLSYSNSGAVRTGEWTCRYKLAKSLASAGNIPMVVVWVSPTCTYCKSLASALGGSAAFRTWMAKRNYVMVFAVGQTSSSTYGTEESDVSAAYSFTEVGISKFPFVGLWWRRNASGAEVKKRFTGRSGLMPSKSGSLAQQFMDSVDQYVGAYAGAGGTIEGDDPDVPSPQPAGTTHKVTFNANGGSSEEKSRTVSDGGRVGALPTATRRGYRLEGWFTKSKGGERATAATTVTKSVTYYAHWLKVYPLSVSVVPGGGGRVAGTGSYAAGESATLKATATGGYVFAGWYSGSSRLTQETSLVCEMGAAELSLTAKFIRKADDAVTIGAFRAAADYATGKEIEPIVLSAAGGSLPTLSVKKLPPGLAFSAEGKDAVPANAIFGTPSKSGRYPVQVSAKTLGGAKASAILTLVIRAGDERIVSAECDPAGGKVSGGGICADGRTSTVSAKPLPGCCFAGWRIDGALVSRSASYACPVDGKDVAIRAVFETKEDDLASVSLAVDGCRQVPEIVGTNVVRCGVRLGIPVAASALTGVSVTASGLPRGLKLVRTPVDEELKEYAYEIAGTPSSPSRTDSKTGRVSPTVAKIVVKTLGESSVTYRHAFVVEPLPSWAYGGFSGFAAADGRGTGAGVAKLTVSAGGKISGKFALFGTNWTYAATGYQSCESPDDPDKGKFRFEGVARKSRRTLPFSAEVTPGNSNCSIALGEGEGWFFSQRRNVWKDRPALPTPKLPKTDLTHFGYTNRLTVTVSRLGSAAFVGALNDNTKVSSSSSTVFIDENGHQKAFLIVPFPKHPAGYIDEIIIDDIK